MLKYHYALAISITTVSRNQSYFQTHTLALQFVIILKVNICKHFNSA